MTQQTLRPMPGPTECTCIGRGNGCLTCLDIIGYDLEAICPGCPVHAGPSYLETKRLTAAECEREWDAAEQDASTALLYHVLGDKRVPAWQVGRFDNAALTWRRFATRPHALEVTP